MEEDRREGWCDRLRQRQMIPKETRQEEEEEGDDDNTTSIFEKHVNKVTRSLVLPPEGRYNPHWVLALGFSSWTDYCKALLQAINQKSINRLQITQNAAVRLFSGTNESV